MRLTPVTMAALGTLMLALVVSNALLWREILRAPATPTASSAGNPIAAAMPTPAAAAAMPGPAAPSSTAGASPELAPYMGRLQTLMHKLQLSLASDNAELAGFYLYESQELVETICESVPAYRGHPIAMWMSDLLSPRLADLERALRAGEREGVGRAFAATIGACNDCHEATSHPFIQIPQSVQGVPYLQRFERKLPGPGAASTRATSSSLPGAVEAAAANIVHVASYWAEHPETDAAPRHPYAGHRRQRTGLGLIMEDEGYILTSYSVLTRPGSSRLPSVVDVQRLDLPDAPHHKATILGVEPTLDLAIVRARLGKEGKGATLESRGRVKPGDALFAITDRGDPLVYAAGTLNQLALKECYQESLSATMFKVEMDLPADSLGCPIFSAAGKVIGLHTRDAADDTESRGEEDRHILPIELAFNIYEPLKAKRGIASPWTGFSVRKLDAGEQARFPVGRFLGGVALEYVWKNSPADELGLRPGDILLRLGYYPTRSVGDFQKWLYTHGVGRRVTLHVLRGNEILQEPYVIEPRPSWAVPR